MRKTAIAILLGLTAASAAEVRPRIRAVTAFIEIDKDNYAARVEEAQKFLARAKEALNAAGFEGANGRITTQPFPEYTKGMRREEAVAMIRGLREAASKGRSGLNIGAAMMRDGDETAPVDLLIDVLSGVSVNANLIVAGEDGIHWRAVRQAARLIQEVSHRSPNGGGNFNFAAIAMMKPYGPYYPGSYHSGKGHAFAIAMEGANVVGDVFSRFHDPVEAERELAAALGKFAKQMEAVAMKVAADTGWRYEGIDATPAPSSASSIGAAIEAFTGAPFGASGTLTASGIITRAVQAAPVKRTGYSGLMIPVMEDPVLARRWAEGTYGLDSILAYSSVCAGGVDTVPLPGDVTEEQTAKIIGDVAWLAYRWNKPLAARLLPAPGKHAGEETGFSGGMLVKTKLQLVPGSAK
jgi:uncharacterized protein (UPF0210 family)